MENLHKGIFQMLSFPFQTSVLCSLCFPSPCVHFCFSSPRVHFWTWSYLGLGLPLMMTHHFLSPALDFPIYTRLLQPPSYISAWVSNRYCRINTLKIHLFSPTSLTTCVHLPLTNLPLFIISAFLSLRQFLLLIHQQFCWLMLLNIHLFSTIFPAITLIQVYNILPGWRH